VEGGKNNGEQNFHFAQKNPTKRVQKNGEIKGERVGGKKGHGATLGGADGKIKGEGGVFFKTFGRTKGEKLYD